MKRKAPKAKKEVAKIVKKVLRSQAEQKTFTWTPVTSTANATTFTMASFLAGAAASGFGIAIGTDYFNRIGDRIRLVAIHFNVKIVPKAVMPDANGSFCRVIVWHDKQANGANALATHLFETDSVDGLRQPQFRNRVSILKDFTHQMVVTGTNAAANVASGPEFFGTFSIYPKQIISYTGTDGEIDTVTKHNYGIGFAGDTAACCDVTVRAQVVYTDM